MNRLASGRIAFSDIHDSSPTLILINELFKKKNTSPVIGKTQNYISKLRQIYHAKIMDFTDILNLTDFANQQRTF